MTMASCTFTTSVLHLNNTGIRNQASASCAGSYLGQAPDPLSQNMSPHSLNELYTSANSNVDDDAIRPLALLPQLLFSFDRWYEHGNRRFTQKKNSITKNPFARRLVTMEIPCSCVQYLQSKLWFSPLAK
jgi:hypothetical protein